MLACFLQECDNALTAAAASQCLVELSHFLGEGIMRGRVEQFDPRYDEFTFEIFIGLKKVSQFSSLHFKMVSMCLEEPTCASPYPSKISPTSPLRLFWPRGTY